MLILNPRNAYLNAKLLARDVHCESHLHSGMEGAQFSIISSSASVISARAVRESLSLSGEEREKERSVPAPPVHRSPDVLVADRNAVVAADCTLEIPKSW